MPPKTNQFKQGQQPQPKKAASSGETSLPGAKKNVNGTDMSANVEGLPDQSCLPMHLLLRTANKVMIQTVVPSTHHSNTNLAVSNTAPSNSNSTTSVTAAASPSSAASTTADTTAGTTSTLLMSSPPVELFKGIDCSECDALTTRDGNIAIVATTTEVRIVFLKNFLDRNSSEASSAAASAYAAPAAAAVLLPSFCVTLAEEKICHMMLSPLETFLVVYRMRDPKRPTAGNMAIYNLASIIEKYFHSSQNPTSTTSSIASSHPLPIMKCVQGAWPALTWTPNEEYCVRYARGLLILHEGAIGGDEDDDDAKAEEEEEGQSRSNNGGVVNPPRCKMELQLPQNKEPVFETAPIVIPSGEVIPNTDKIPALEQAAKNLPPLFVLFKPHNKNQLATLGFYRLPMFREPQFQIQLQRAEGAQLEWNRNATHMCVISKQEPERGDNSYYAKTSLVLVNIRDKKDIVVKFPGVATVGAGASYEAVHDVKWSPSRDEFIVIHGTMPRNKATLYNEKGQPLFQFGEAPRNLSAWSPNGGMFVIGGTGSLVGEFQFYNRDGLDTKQPQQQKTITTAGRPSTASSGNSMTTTTSIGGKLGSFNEKSSEQTWSPDGRHLLCATVFGKLRIDNKFFIYKHNGERCCEIKFKTDAPAPAGAGAAAATVVSPTSTEGGGGLHQALWIPRPAGFYGPHRTPSPTVAAAVAPKPALFKARGAGNAAISAALSRAPTAASSVAARPAGLLPGENPVQQKPKRR